jgi:MFS family permease
VISFLVAATVTSPLFATLSAIFGRKPLLLAALTFLTCGSFIAAVTGNVTGMLIGRTVQGTGTGGIAVLSNLIVSDLVSAVDRWKWSGIFGIMYVSQSPIILRCPS